MGTTKGLAKRRDVEAVFRDAAHFRELYEAHGDTKPGARGDYRMAIWLSELVEPLSGRLLCGGVVNAQQVRRVRYAFGLRKFAQKAASAAAPVEVPTVTVWTSEDATRQRMAAALERIASSLERIERDGIVTRML